MDQPDWEDNFDRELLQHCVRGLSYLVEDEETGATHYRKTVDCVGRASLDCVFTVLRAQVVCCVFLSSELHKR